MSKKHLKRSPHGIKKAENCVAWWHEDNGGIDVRFSMQSQTPQGNVFIPWSSIRAALKRKDKK
jgi:hypothetical protein